jgi:2-polyprenyl-6-methoxyphenol hydroxylase-like FAD-dependent oxidoreductase
MASPLAGKQAVVVGAGIAGLSAAGALADYYEQVVLLERDSLPLEAAHRAGTPQSRHAHVMLGGGQRALGELFPGLEQDLERAGAVALRVGLDNRLEMPGFNPFPQRDLGWPIYSMSRPLVELTVRQRVQQHRNVEVRERCRVLEWVATADGAAVTAIRCENAEGNSETLPADLVVDASGRGELTLGLLRSIGQKRPDETFIGVDIGYATAVFEMPDDAPSGWRAVRTLPCAPENSRSGLLFPLEGERWIVTLGGRRDNKPPGDDDGFLAHARQLSTPTLYNAIKQARRLGKIARFGFPASVWRHFERLEKFPRGLLPFGDAICRFNPVYGQGMSVAAQEAVLLRRLLGDGLADPSAGLAPAFFAEACRLIEAPWMLAAVPDFAFPETQGQRPADLQHSLAFRRALNRLAAGDPAVHKQIFEVQHLISPPSVLREPILVERVRAVMAEA